MLVNNSSNEHKLATKAITVLALMAIIACIVRSGVSLVSRRLLDSSDAVSVTPNRNVLVINRNSCVGFTVDNQLGMVGIATLASG